MNLYNYLQLLAQAGAILTGHFVYTSGKHGSAYVNKDRVYTDTALVSLICQNLADHFGRNLPQVVVGPAVGGVILSQWTAFHLNASIGGVVGVYAERAERSYLKVGEGADPGGFDLHGFMGNICGHQVIAGEELVVKENRFVIKRGYDKLVNHKRVLVVEDVITTGGTVKKVVQAVRECRGEVIGVGAMCNRGQVSAENLDVPALHSVVDVPLEAWPESECPLCAEGAPVNTDVGKGREFLARRGRK